MTARNQSYGQHGAPTWVDRFGIWLSQRAIRHWLPARNDLEVLELGCGYRATQLVALADRLRRAVGVDFAIAPEVKRRTNFTCYEGPIENMLPRLERGTFDAVLLISVLEHLHDAQAALD